MKVLSEFMKLSPTEVGLFDTLDQAQSLAFSEVLGPIVGHETQVLFAETHRQFAKYRKGVYDSVISQDKITLEEFDGGANPHVEFTLVSNPQANTEWFQPRCQNSAFSGRCERSPG